MNKKLIIIAGLALALSGNLIADATLNKGKEANKLAKMAGEKSPFYRASKESFPKDYFLVSQNLPFLVGISLFHPNSDTLNLDKKQLAAIVKSKETTVPVAVQIAKQIVTTHPLTKQPNHNKISHYDKRRSKSNIPPR